MSEQNKDAELLPCPFCGSNDLEVHGKPGILNAHDDVGCNGCNAFTPAPTWNRRSLPVGVPDGYAVVPVEPTPEMLHAGVARAVGAYPIYRAMLAAAPTVKAEQVDEAPVDAANIRHLEQCNVDGCERCENLMYFYQACDDCGAWGHNDSGLCSCPNKSPSLPAAGSAAEDDRSRFEAEFRKHHPNVPLERYDADTYPTAEYRIGWVHEQYVGWQMACALSAQQSAPERVSVPVEDWSIFAGYLIDKCEGYEVSEENIQHWLSEMLADQHYGALFRREKQPHGMPSAIELAIEAAEEEHGGLRAAAKAIGVDAGYLSRLKSGEKLNPGDDVLAALGLERVVTYRALLASHGRGEA